ncbi:MAG: cytidylate kinase-like family protein [Desulforhopalus sp.]
MPIITISRGSYYHGKSIAEKLAKKLGYSCLSRDQIVENLDTFHLPEIKLVRGLNDAFSILDRFPHGKKRFKAAIRSAILQQFLTGNIVYHGLVGHHFVENIKHVLKVRIIADTEKRVSDEMDRENIPEEQARYILKTDDEERRKWGMFLYGIDIMDPETYNLMIRIGHLSEDEAVDIIANAVNLQSFQETEESKAALIDSAINALVSTRLFDFPNAVVAVKNGRARISLKAPEDQQPVIHDRINQMLTDIDGMHELTIQFETYF